MDGEYILSETDGLVHECQLYRTPFCGSKNPGSWKFVKWYSDKGDFRMKDPVSCKKCEEEKRRIILDRILTNSDLPLHDCLPMLAREVFGKECHVSREVEVEKHEFVDGLEHYTVRIEVDYDGRAQLYLKGNGENQKYDDGDRCSVEQAVWLLSSDPKARELFEKVRNLLTKDNQGRSFPFLVSA